jgi:hypothetical protein
MKVISGTVFVLVKKCVSIVFRIEEILGDAKSRVPFFVCKKRVVTLCPNLTAKNAKNAKFLKFSPLCSWRSWR